MSYRSGRRRVIAWSIILALALCALIWGLANGPRLHWGVANRNNFTTVKQQEMDDSVSQLRIDWGLGDIILTQSEDSSLHILQRQKRMRTRSTFLHGKQGMRWRFPRKKAPAGGIFSWETHVCQIWKYRFPKNIRERF